MTLRFIRLSGLAATAGLAALLSGCVVAPIGPPGYYRGPVVVAPPPPPVVIIPRPWGYGGGYYGRGYYGNGHRGGYGGYRDYDGR